MRYVTPARLGLLSVLLLAAALRLWHLDRNGWGNEYYSAAVRSMSASWHNFLYTAFDPAGFVSVDKPPVGLWIQVASVKLSGFCPLSVLVPQVLEGLAAVWLVYHLVQRRFGILAGLLAALFLAVTPVSVAIDRSSNVDSCLVLVLLLAAWALTRAAEEGDRRFLLLAMVLIGLGFNVKMLAAFVVLPVFVLVYLLGAPLSWRRRLVDLALGAFVLVAVSLSWGLVYDLTPPPHRPYAGTSDHNSILELAVGPYGVGRFVRQARPSVTAIDPGSDQTSTTRELSVARARQPVRPGPRTGPLRVFVRVPAGPLRLTDGQLAAQVGWLFPMALIGMGVATLQYSVRRPLDPAHLALMLWFGWALTYGIVYSFAGGFFHFYYMSTMAPPLAALAGVGTVSLWRPSREPGWLAWLLPGTLLLTCAWQLGVETSALPETGDAWVTWLHRVLIGGTLIAAGALIVLRALACRASRMLTAGALALGLVSLLVIPMAWTLSNMLTPGEGILPSADLARLLPVERNMARLTRRQLGNSRDLAQLVAFLRANHQGERFLLATSSATLAAPIIIHTGEAVMARGGFHGLDPILTPERLSGIAEARQIRFVMLGDLSDVSRRLGGETAGEPITDWIRANGRPVDPTLWRTNGQGGPLMRMRLYDLRPEAGLVPPPEGADAPST
jgi:4-amino-4-deoxy-L-arabinose transferase-like glycosyltransferase